jgi:outer membrane protein assembly factor BamB
MWIRSDWSLRGLAVLMLGTGAFARGENWPQWRGPTGTGVSAETGLPAQWDQTTGVLWRRPLPGPAGSTPIVWNGRIFLTSADAEGGLRLLAIDRAGQILWNQKITDGDQDVRSGEGNFASPSPSTDGRRVWAMFGNGVLTCRDVDGGEVWTVDLQERYGPFNIQFGMTSTPLLDGDRLYVMCMYTGASYIACLNKNTGEEIWKHNRASDAIAECEHSYASPVLYRDDQREFLLAHGADYVTAHRLTDGSEIFRCGALNGKGPLYNPTLRFVASPAAADGLIVAPSAKKGPVLGLRPDATGDVTASGEGRLWRLERGTPDVPSPLIHDGLVYLCSEEGVLMCVDAKTGEVHYNERVQVGRHRASPVYADGKIYVVSRSGVVSVVRAGPKYELLAKNDMKEDVAASLAISDGRIYVRTFDALYAVGEK